MAGAGEPTVLARFRQKLLERGASSIKGLGRTFRIYDDDGSWTLSFEEFSKGLADYGVGASYEEARKLFGLFDKDSTGTIDFEEFLTGIRGNLNENRLKVVLEAFTKADRSGNGTIGVEDMKRVYKFSDNEKFKSGQWTQKQVFDEFLKKFEPGETKRDEVVTKEEFVNYYAGISASIDDDATFELMLRNAWKI